jgi:hypothetical protein
MPRSWLLALAPMLVAGVGGWRLMRSRSRRDCQKYAA